MAGERLRASLGTAAFFLAAPAVVAGLMPWLITDWQVDERLPGSLRAVGAALAGIAVVALVSSFAKFALEGLGTPSPTAPTKRLVVSGAYRFVRNPMYVAVLSTILGQALLFGSTALVGYAALIAISFVSFVLLYEEPTMRATYGAQYERYRAAVPGWVPRLRPWHEP
ncbi:MAG TPA: isoprenylcysteine carboxylmethyltransferase family protein [Solirubrobacterales bacterium]|nr:isoprenylcysteine carboxylmethyltransferase family protein [Solirubrobacterales bacterium]